MTVVVCRNDLWGRCDVATALEVCPLYCSNPFLLALPRCKQFDAQTGMNEQGG